MRASRLATKASNGIGLLTIQGEPGVRKSGTPDSVEMPAPVKATTTPRRIEQGVEVVDRVVGLVLHAVRPALPDLAYDMGRRRPAIQAVCVQPPIDAAQPHPKAAAMLPRAALNPDLLDTGTPPIPQAQGWARAYDGKAGPLIDLSQAVPGSPPPEALLQRLARGRGLARRDALRRHHRRHGPARGLCRRDLARSMAAAIAPAETIDHLRLQPGLCRDDDGAGAGRRQCAAADALVLQPRDDADHARRRAAARCPAIPPPASCPMSPTPRG